MQDNVKTIFEIDEQLMPKRLGSGNARRRQLDSRIALGKKGKRRRRRRKRKEHDQVEALEKREREKKYDEEREWLVNQICQQLSKKEK